MRKVAAPSFTESALQRTRGLLLAQRNDRAHWEGQLSASALSTATAISALAFYLHENSKTADGSRIGRIIQQGIQWLIAEQNNDGGWGDTANNYSNISTSMLVVAAFHAAEYVNQYPQVIERAKRYVDSAGGVDGIRKRYGGDESFAVPILANCAMAGMVEWKEVSALPFEAACLPQRFYHLLRLPVVSYAIPALVAIGNVKFAYDPPKNPLLCLIRNKSRARSLRVLQRMQPASGGYLEAVPLTSFVCMGLTKSGKAKHPVVEQGIRFLLASFRDIGDDQGTWPIDTNLATWVTTLAINALCADTNYEFPPDHNWNNTLDWILGCQYVEKHPFTGAAPGGWGWSDLSGAVPDADDTPGALLALKQLRQRLQVDESTQMRIDIAARNGIEWLLNLQNRDRGWPTFCRGWGRLPFDRSGNDITAHVVRALHVWKDTARDRLRVEKAVDRGFRYLAKNQRSDGSWLPLWFGNQDQVDDINPFYGTAKVLHAYWTTGRVDTKPAQNGLEWLRRNQNDDGGWGGGPSIDWNHPEMMDSSVEETALCTEALLLDQNSDSTSAARRGLQWLELAVECGMVNNSSPIGFYFAKLWYFERLYPLIFATSALGLAHSRTTQVGDRREKQA